METSEWPLMLVRASSAQFWSAYPEFSCINSCLFSLIIVQWSDDVGVGAGAHTTSGHELHNSTRVEWRYHLRPRSSIAVKFSLRDAWSVSSAAAAATVAFQISASVISAMTFLTTLPPNGQFAVYIAHLASTPRNYAVLMISLSCAVSLAI